MDDFKSDDQEKKVLPDDKVSIQIRYLNLTFQEMFTAYKERLRLMRYEKKKTRLSKMMEEENKEGYSKLNHIESYLSPKVWSGGSSIRGLDAPNRESIL